MRNALNHRTRDVIQRKGWAECILALQAGQIIFQTDPSCFKQINFNYYKCFKPIALQRLDSAERSPEVVVSL